MKWAACCQAAFEEQSVPDVLRRAVAVLPCVAGGAGGSGARAVAGGSGDGGAELGHFTGFVVQHVLAHLNQVCVNALAQLACSPCA